MILRTKSSQLFPHRVSNCYMITGIIKRLLESKSFSAAGGASRKLTFDKSNKYVAKFIKYVRHIKDMTKNEVFIMPIPNSYYSVNSPCEDAVNKEIASIADKELILSSLLNKEGEKIQYVIGTLEGEEHPGKPASVKDLLAVNNGVHKTLRKVAALQMCLNDKLDKLLKVDCTKGTVFAAIKSNVVNNLPLADAVYILLKDSIEIARTVSTIAGEVIFTDLPAGTYELLENTPPAGFQPNETRLSVVVEPDSRVTIEGKCADGYNLFNVPLTMLIFRKLDESDSLPLPYAVFQLMQNDTVIGTATSNIDGIVNFRELNIGSYKLLETEVPDGYQPNDTVYDVICGTDGSITVDGIPLGNFFIGNKRIREFSCNVTF